MELKIIHKKIKELKPADWNPRDISDTAMAGLKVSLKTYGMPQPVIFNKRTGNIVGGHQRTKAAASLGWETVPCVEVDLSLIEEKALNVTLNNQKISGHFTHSLGDILDEIRIELGDDFFRDIKLDEIEIPPLPEEEQAEENERADSIPEVAQNEMGVQLGDIFQLGEHRLMCGDSTDLQTVEKLMNGEKADMVFTDPPYGIAYDNAKRWEKTKKQSENAKKNAGPMIIGDDSDFDPSFILKFFEYCKEIFIWGMQYYPDKLKRGGAIVWNRKTKEQEECPFADFELCWSKAPRNAMAWIIWGGYISKEKGEARLHTTQKPIALAEWFLNRWGAEKKLIVDLFLGSGSTLIACEKTNRKCYGMELDPHYCSVIIKRWETFTNKKAVKL